MKKKICSLVLILTLLVVPSVTSSVLNSTDPGTFPPVGSPEYQAILIKPLSSDPGTFPPV